MIETTVAGAIEEVRASIGAAARRASRSPDEITLMAVSKTFPVERIAEAYAAGIHVFGENRVQEFAGKTAGLHGLSGAKVHLIGHLQSNKAAKAVELFDAVDSLDSLRLAHKLNEAAARLDKLLPVLVEINVGGEKQKTGLAAGSRELEELLQAAPSLEHLQFRGLMTVPPYTEDPEGARIFFRTLREVARGLAARRLPGLSLDVLSMGMSHDFAVAIEEGSTCVRIGTAIFGGRTAADPRAALQPSDSGPSGVAGGNALPLSRSGR